MNRSNPLNLMWLVPTEGSETTKVKSDLSRLGKVFLCLSLFLSARKDDVMKLTDRLYEAAKPIWDGYLTQPFVKELGEGTLSMERFRFYMIQDYRYLLQYSKVFALGIVKAEEEELQRLFASMVHDTLDGEMKVHKPIWKDWESQKRSFLIQKLP
jgi:hypothetical protein